jgi:hypothetical protein
MLITPQILAYVADLTGLFNAYAIAGGLLVAALVMAMIANKIAAQQPVAEPAL